MTTSRARAAIAAAVLMPIAVACSRTGLEVDDATFVDGVATVLPTPTAPPDSPLDAAPPPLDAGVEDAAPDVPVDAPVDAAPDVLDAAPDVGVDAPADGPPVKADCSDPSITWVYVVTDSGELYGYDPATNVYHPRGTIACPSAPNATPFSMAVSRTGTAFVVFNDGNLFRVSTKNAACSATPYVSGKAGFTTFGMGFSTVDQGPAENLYVAQTPEMLGGAGPSELGIIDTTTFDLTKVGNFMPGLDGSELTGTGDGRLYGFAIDSTNAIASRIVRIDKANAKIVEQTELPDVEIAGGWAFAFWGGDFWLFTAPNDVPTLQHYSPATGLTTTVGSPPGKVVGAGVSTCAPEQ
jgi:hypothetical protein